MTVDSQPMAHTSQRCEACSVYVLGSSIVQGQQLQQLSHRLMQSLQLQHGRLVSLQSQKQDLRGLYMLAETMIQMTDPQASIFIR